MTAPDPPAEAVEAAERAAKFEYGAMRWLDWHQIAVVALAAALPHLRAQVLAEVDAALMSTSAYRGAAEWLRDTLTPEETP